MTKSEPLVSVLMTVYNREKYMAEAIDSVVASTYQNWELVIVDDRSKDNSVAIAKQYADKDNRIKVYVNEKNLGDYPNRNQAAAYAKGKYLKYVDADDILYEHTLFYMVEMMERYPEADWAAFSSKQNPAKPHPYVAEPHEQYKGNYIENKGYFSRSPLSVIIKREVFEKNSRFKELKMVGDFEMWNRLGLNHKLLVLPHSHGFVWYRIHDSQESNTISQYDIQYRRIKLDYLNRPECPLNTNEKALALKKIKDAYKKKYVKSLLKLQFGNLKYI